jgi:GDP-mannose 6-dehydrogenase
MMASAGAARNVPTAAARASRARAGARRPRAPTHTDHQRPHDHASSVPHPVARMQRVRIAVFGLGYVGCISAACFADRGNEVVGVDVSTDKVDLLNAGRATIVEEMIGPMVEQQVSSGALRATTDVAEAVSSSSIALVCVGTPSLPGGGLVTAHLERVAEQIGAALAGRTERYTVVIRSTMLPGTCEELVIPRLEEASGLRAGRDFGVAVNPEFLREGSSVRDFNDPPKTVVGELDPESGETVMSLYAGLPGPRFRVPIRVAEMTKYVDNSFHALKVGFANEIGAICKAYGLDSHAVMDIFRADTKLNISPAYLKPGFAFGGSCLPKDLRAIVHAARRADVSVPILEHVLPSNDEHLRRVFEAIATRDKPRVGLLGLSFKSGTDDLRESPMVELAERLLGRGFELLIHDANVLTSRLAGANRAYVDARIPHLHKLMVSSPASVVAHADVLVLATSDPEAIAAAGRADDDTLVVDLVRAGDGTLEARDRYDGVAW